MIVWKVNSACLLAEIFRLWSYIWLRRLLFRPQRRRCVCCVSRGSWRRIKASTSPVSLCTTLWAPCCLWVCTSTLSSSTRTSECPIRGAYLSVANKDSGKHQATANWAILQSLTMSGSVEVLLSNRYKTRACAVYRKIIGTGAVYMRNINLQWGALHLQELRAYSSFYESVSESICDRVSQWQSRSQCVWVKSVSHIYVTVCSSQVLVAEADSTGW